MFGKEAVCPDGLFVPAVFQESDFYLNSLKYSIYEYFVWDMEIFHVTHLNCLPISKMSKTLLFPLGDLISLLLVVFDFSFFVVIEIGSLAYFLCLSNVDLSCIF